MALLLLLLFSSALLSPAAALTVRDTDGDALQPNSGAYYMIAVKPPSAGGVELAGQEPRGACPKKLGLASSAENKGIPVVIAPVETTATTVEVGMPVELHFAFSYHCVPDTAWGVEPNPNGPDYLVPLRRVGPNIVSEQFELSYDKSSKSYFLTGCDNHICQRVGVKEENSELFLVLGRPSQDFRFVFYKYKPRLQMSFE